MTSSTKMTFREALRRARSIIALIVRVGEGASNSERTAGKSLHGKARADSSTHPNSPYGTRSRVFVYTQPLDAAALHVADMQGCETLAPAKSYSAHHPIQQPHNHYHGRRVDFCEGDEGFVCVGSSGKTAKVSAFTRKATATDTQEG